VINNHKSLLEEIAKASFALALACRHGEYRDTRAIPAPFHFSHANKEISPLSSAESENLAVSGSRLEGELFQRSKRIQDGSRECDAIDIRGSSSIIL
jgi:hypothetical protein